MNGAQEKARLEEERRRQEVRVLCAALSLTLGYNWRSGGRASHLSWLAQEEEALQRARAEAEAVLHGGTTKLRTSTRYKDQNMRLCCKRQENARLEEERQRQEVPCKTAVFHFGGLTCWRTSAKLQCFVLPCRDAGGSADAQTRGAPQS